MKTESSRANQSKYIFKIQDSPGQDPETCSLLGTQGLCSCVCAGTWAAGTVPGWGIGGCQRARWRVSRWGWTGVGTGIETDILTL